MTDFDYIIIGAGAAGLMLADGMGKDPVFRDKSILLLDKDPKQSNDRTWCFWEKGKGRFDKILYKSWSTIFFGGEQYSKNLEIAPYTYKMIRGIDFYKDHLKRIQGYPNITFMNETVAQVEDQNSFVQVTAGAATYTAAKVFNSIFDYKTITGQEKYPVLQQHFTGWFLKTKEPAFNPGTATFMDFSIPQKGNTRFMYVLPFSTTEALVEYTLFSEELLSEKEYEEAIIAYLNKNPGSPEYEILSREKGNIPMTCYDFEAHNSGNVLHIGTAGGWAKPSTGYTFRNTSRNTDALLLHLKNKGEINTFSIKNRFRYYDLLLLDILHKNNEKGQNIFETLFKNRSPQLIFKFLDEETTIWEDMKIITGCPKKEFIMAFLRRYLF